MTPEIFILLWLLIGFLTWLFFIAFSWFLGEDITVKDIAMLLVFLPLGMVGPIIMIVIALYIVTEENLTKVLIKGRKIKD